MCDATQTLVLVEMRIVVAKRYVDMISDALYYLDTLVGIYPLPILPVWEIMGKYITPSR